MTKLTITAAIVAALALSAGAARAESNRLVLVHETITYRSDEIATSAGARAVLDRIEHAARRLCVSHPPSPINPGSSRTTLNCRRQAVDRAVATLDAPLVTAAHGGEPGVALAAR